MIGLHVSHIDNCDLEQSLKHAKSQGIKIVQIFLWNPQRLKKVKYDPDAIKALGLKIYVHSSYLTNPWGSAAYHMALCKVQLDAQREICTNGGGVVFHLPVKPPEDLVGPLLEICKYSDRVLLENKGRGYAKPGDINHAIKVWTSVGIPIDRIKFCIDTAHLDAGDVDVSTHQAATDWLNALDHPECIHAIHLNGNSGTGARDIHEIPFTKNDTIWHKIPYHESGVRVFVDFCKDHGRDLIIEGHYGNASNRAAALVLIKLINRHLK